MTESDSELLTYSGNKTCLGLNGGNSTWWYKKGDLELQPADIKVKAGGVGDQKRSESSGKTAMRSKEDTYPPLSPTQGVGEVTPLS